jgi:hypothetical protein
MRVTAAARRQKASMPAGHSKAACSVAVFEPRDGSGDQPSGAQLEVRADRHRSDVGKVRGERQRGKRDRIDERKRTAEWRMHGHTQRMPPSGERHEAPRTWAASVLRSVGVREPHRWNSSATLTYSSAPMGKSARTCVQCPLGNTMSHIAGPRLPVAAPCRHASLRGQCSLGARYRLRTVLSSKPAMRGR